MLARSPIPDLSRPRFFHDLRRGMGLPFSAFAVIFRSPGLLALSLVSGVVTALALVGMAIGFWPLSSSLASRVITGDGFWWRGAELGLSVVVYVVFLVVGALTVPNLLLAPFGDPISESTEALCGEFAAPPFTLSGLLRGTALSLWHTGLRIVLMTLGTILFWPLNLIPVAGSVLWFLFSSIWTMFWLATEHLSAPMARHQYPFAPVVSVLLRRLPLALGFGATLIVLLWIPVVNFFLLPIAIVGGTLLFRGLRAAGTLLPPSSAVPSR